MEKVKKVNLDKNTTSTGKKPVSKKTIIIALVVYSIVCLILGFVLGILLGVIL